MSNLAKGNSYENFVEHVYQAILTAEKKAGNVSTVKIERKKKITSKSGTPAEIDIYWEYEIAGIVHRTAIECKNHKSCVDIKEVRDFARKIEHISGLKGLMASKSGFSRNAIQEASSDQIDLLIVREQMDKDWDGYLREVNIVFHVSSPARTVKVEPRLNKEWLLAQGFKLGDVISYQAQNNATFIEDGASGFRYSLYELEGKSFFENKGDGRHVWEKVFQDGWISFDKHTYKMDSIRIEYVNPSVIKSEMNIDFSRYVLAIIEYVNRNKPAETVLKSGERKPHQ